MKSIHIRNLSNATLSGLKRRAALHRRSLQKEVESVLHDAATMLPSDEATVPNAKLRLHSVASGRTDSEWNRESIYSDDGR
jgi:plasmid stability protein